MLRKDTQHLINDLHADLDRLDWPKTLYVKNGKTFQDLVVALEAKVDWHFEETDEGFPYFLLGPTMVRVDNQGQPASAKLIPWEDAFAKAAREIDLDAKVRDMIDEGGPVDPPGEAYERFTSETTP